MTDFFSSCFVAVYADGFVCCAEMIYLKIASEILALFPLSIMWPIVLVLILKFYHEFFRCLFHLIGATHQTVTCTVMIMINSISQTTLLQQYGSQNEGDNYISGEL